MPIDADKVKSLLAFKEKLGKKVKELESELSDLQSTLDVVNSILLEKGFKRAEMTKEPETDETSQPKETTGEPLTPSEDVIPLKTSTGELLAILHVTENSLRALPAGDKEFNVNTPPFTQFLVERVLTKMQERDSELVRTEQLPPGKIFAYNIIREGDIIREITIKNVDGDRLRELRSSIRWTLEKMHEKMKAQT